MRRKVPLGMKLCFSHTFSSLSLCTGGFEDNKLPVQLFFGLRQALRMSTWESSK